MGGGRRERKPGGVEKVGRKGEVFKDLLSIRFTSRRTLTAKRLSIGEAATQTTFGSSRAPPVMDHRSTWGITPWRPDPLYTGF